WQIAARLEQLEKPGNYATSEIAGEPIVVVRGDDSVIRGFFNVCRHHAAAVMTEPNGCATHLQCPYHGWTYSLDGSLKSAPDLGGVCNFDRNSMGLVAAETAVWKRWVVVRLDRQGATMSSLPDLDLNNYQWFERRHYMLDCNWK